MPFCTLRLTAKKPLPVAYPKELKTLGDHLRKRRLELGPRQIDVATRLGASEATIVHWETNLTRPALKFIPAIVSFIEYNPFTRPHALVEPQQRLHRRPKAQGSRRHDW